MNAPKDETVILQACTDLVLKLSQEYTVSDAIFLLSYSLGMIVGSQPARAVTTADALKRVHHVINLGVESQVPTKHG